MHNTARTGWWGIVLLILVSLISKDAAWAAETQQDSQSLFAVPLGEVLDIEVEAQKWKGRFEEGIFLLEAEQASRFLSEDSSAGQYPVEVLLAINGVEAGPVESLAEVYSYIHFFAGEMDYVEFYVGESSIWWSGGHYGVTVNIVTGIDEDCAGCSDDQLLEEVAEP